MEQNSTTAKFLALALAAGLFAFAFGLCLGHILRHFDIPSLIGLVLTPDLAALLIFLAWRSARTLAVDPKAVRQFVVSCILFCMLTTGFGINVGGYLWYAADYLRAAGVACWSVFTACGIYCVRRDAKRLTSSGAIQVGPIA